MWTLTVACVVCSCVANNTQLKPLSNAKRLETCLCYRSSSNQSFPLFDFILPFCTLVIYPGAIWTCVRVHSKLLHCPWTLQTFTQRVNECPTKCIIYNSALFIGHPTFDATSTRKLMMMMCICDVNTINNLVPSCSMAHESNSIPPHIDHIEEWNKKLPQNAAVRNSSNFRRTRKRFLLVGWLTPVFVVSVNGKWWTHTTHSHTIVCKRRYTREAALIARSWK